MEKVRIGMTDSTFFITLAIDHEISISDDKIIDYISKKRNRR